MNDAALDYVIAFPDQFGPEFFEWLRDNGHIYAEFERRALRVARFRRHYSARTIVEVMRHETAIGELRGDFKINDHATPDLARLFAGLHPQYSGLFAFRRERVAA